MFPVSGQFEESLNPCMEWDSNWRTLSASEGQCSAATPSCGVRNHKTREGKWENQEVKVSLGYELEANLGYRRLSEVC